MLDRSDARSVASEDLDVIRAGIEASARRAVALLGGHDRTDALPLRLPKGRIVALGVCERHALAAARVQASQSGPSSDRSSVPILRGRAIEVFVAHEIAVGVVADPFEDLLSWLGSRGELDVRDEVIAARDLLDLGPLASAARAWAGLDPLWWPRTQSSAALHLADGAVRCEGRTDVELGGPMSGRPGVVVEVKLGRPHPGHLAEVMHYSLLVALRDRAAPAVVARWYPGAALAEMAVTVDVLRSAARRVSDAIDAWAELVLGRPPAERPGPTCRWCPDADVCPSFDAATDPDGADGPEGSGVVVR